MKVIFSKTSKTGIQLLEILEDGKKCQLAAYDLMKEVGASGYRPASFYLFGGISSFSFDKKPTEKHWTFRQKWDDYVPNRKYKEGKIIYKKMEDLPKESPNRFNEIFEFKSPFSHPGLNWNETHICVSITDRWIYENQVVIPEDGVEITLTQYRNDFENKTDSPNTDH